VDLNFHYKSHSLSRDPSPASEKEEDEPKT